VSPTPGRVATIDGPTDLRRIAGEYARRSGRAEVTVVRSLTELGPADVALALVDQLDVADLERCWASGSVGFGVLAAGDSARLERRARHCADRLLAGPRPVRTVTELVLSQNDDLTAGSSTWFRGDARTPGPVLDALFGAGSDLLAVTSHSDGIDLSLGHERVLCPLVDDTGAIRVDRAPGARCVTTGHCHRRDRPVTAAFDDGELVGARSLRADLLVVNACMAILAPGGHLQARVGGTGLVGALLDDATEVTNLVVNWGLDLVPRRAASPLLTDLLATPTLGDGLSAYRRRDGMLPCVLFGDPLTALVAGDVVPPADPEVLLARAPLDPEGPERHRPTTAEDRRRLADFLAARDRLPPEPWLRHVRRLVRLDTNEAVRCWCGAPLRRWLLDGTAWMFPRAVMVCPSCGMHSDVPPTRPVRCRWIDGGVRLSAAGLSSASVGRAIVRGFHPSERQCVALRWDGAGLTSGPLGDLGPAVRGPLRCAAVVVDSGDVLVGYVVGGSTDGE